MDLKNLIYGYIFCSFTRPNLSYADGHILHLISVFSDERSRAIMALLFNVLPVNIERIKIWPDSCRQNINLIVWQLELVSFEIPEGFEKIKHDVCMTLVQRVSILTLARQSQPK